MEEKAGAESSDALLRREERSATLRNRVLRVAAKFPLYGGRKTGFGEERWRAIDGD